MMKGVKETTGARIALKYERDDLFGRQVESGGTGKTIH